MVRGGTDARDSGFPIAFGEFLAENFDAYPTPEHLGAWQAIEKLYNPCADGRDTDFDKLRGFNATPGTT
jgi:hypothetical protein